MFATRQKILPLDELRRRLDDERRRGRRIVLANGCFDVLHVGHVRYLEGARREGDLLVVAINSDSGVRALKGPGRPVFPQQERAEILAALACVDYVTIFDALTPRDLIARLLPDVLVKGGDWGPEEIVGRAEVESAGGRVVSIPVEPAYSTTAILDRMRRAGLPPSGSP